MWDSDHVFTAGIALIGVASGFWALVMGAPPAAAVAAVLTIGGLALLVWGECLRREEKREEWLDEYKKQFVPHVTDFYAVLDYAFSEWVDRTGTNVGFATWRDMVEEAGWVFRYDDRRGDPEDLCLSFAESVYSPDAMDIPTLKDVSTVDDRDCRQFHYNHRRHISHYLAEVGEKRRKDDEYRAWVDGELCNELSYYADVAKMAVYLSLPLSEHTDPDEPTDASSAFGWCQCIATE